MHAERVNGYDPLAVIDAFRRKIQIIANGKGPVLLDTVTYRISGHSPSDASSYRSKEEIESWLRADSLLEFRGKMLKARVLSESVLDETRKEIESIVFQMFKLAVDPVAAPRIPVDSNLIDNVMFSNKKLEKCGDGRPEFLQDWSRNPRVQQIRGKVRTPLLDGKPVPKMKAFNIRDAIFEALAYRFSIDPTMVAFGEENRDWGGAFVGRFAQNAGRVAHFRGH
jgi:2-oxoisovalerate dehydrogenase E1 component